MTQQSLHALRGLAALSRQEARRGLGAIGASAFTMTAAEALDEHLTTNNCAGCDDLKSTLRQLTFAFKAAVLTDTATMDSVKLNMRDTLAMTAFGPGTDAALALVLGAAKTYHNGPCTDDNGRCLAATNLVTPDIPAAIAALEAQLSHQIQGAMQKAPYVPQPELVAMLVQGFAALINQIGFELAKLKAQVTPVKLDLPSPYVDATPVVTPSPAVATTPPATTAKKGWTTTEKFLVGGAVGVAIAGAGLLAYYAGKKRKD